MPCNYSSYAIRACTGDLSPEEALKPPVVSFHVRYGFRLHSSCNFHPTIRSIRVDFRQLFLENACFLLCPQGAAFL
jgi:hypothetical protein